MFGHLSVVFSSKMSKRARLFKFASFLICSLLFAAQMKKILTQYFAGETTTSISYDIYEKLQLPEVTVCPLGAHKSSKLLSTEEDYYENTFEAEEIFAEVWHWRIFEFTKQLPLSR